MKKTYTPSISELSAKYGESYFTVTTCRKGHKAISALEYGTLEDLISIMDAIIFSAYGDGADLDKYSARISYDGAELVYIANVGEGPDSARIIPQPAGETFEIRQIDAWSDGEGWIYNTTYNLGEFTTVSADIPRAFRAALNRLGVTFAKGRTTTVYDGDVYEIIDRATREPLFVAIPKEA